MRLSAKRTEIVFDYEFLDGSVEKFTYIGPSTKQQDAMMEILDGEYNQIALVEEGKKILKENLSGDKKLIKKMLDELEKEGDIYDFKKQLDEAVGNVKKKKRV